MLFGSYCINEQKPAPPRLSLGFSKGEELNFYACSVKFVEGELDDAYDWSADVMNPTWDPAAARRKLRAAPRWPMHCGTISCLPASATSSRTKCGFASACTT